LDQLTKYGVFAWLQPQGAGDTQGRRQIVPDAFELLAQFNRVGDVGGSDLAPKVNQGALFGLGGEYGYLANGIFAAVSIVAALAIIYWSARRSTARDLSLCAALGLILAGTLGNLYDRLVFDGVRDFLHFYWFEWPVFNVADCCLVCGAFLLLAQALWNQPAPKEQVVSDSLLPRQVA
jgi:lipoprotein signal peptidase